MQTLLNDIELDVHELRCLIQSISADANPVLRMVAKRNIYQMQERLNALTELLGTVPEEAPAVPAAFDVVENTAAPQAIAQPATETLSETVHVSEIVSPAPQILAERIKPVTDLRHAISLNDSFRFARELFHGDAARMDEVVRRLGASASLDEAMSVFMSTVQPDEENEAATDFVELLKKYFS